MEPIRNSEGNIAARKASSRKKDLRTTLIGWAGDQLKNNNQHLVHKGLDVETSTYIQAVPRSTRLIDRSRYSNQQSIKRRSPGLARFEEGQGLPRADAGAVAQWRDYLLRSTP